MRLSSVLAVSDLDECRDASLLQLPGGRAVVVGASLDQVLDWFLDASVAHYPAGMTREALLAALSLANLRLLASRLMLSLLDEGVLPRAEVELIRDECLDASRVLIGTGDPLRQACGLEAARDFADLFSAALSGGRAGR